MGRMVWVALTGGMLVAASPALAADNAMKVCGARYQAAKTGKTLPVGQTWNQYLAQCRGAMTPAAAMAAPARKVEAPAGAVGGKPVATRATRTNTGGTPSAAQTAMRGRMKQCSAQWQADKAAKKIPAGQTWPRYWSACSARLKG